MSPNAADAELAVAFLAQHAIVARAFPSLLELGAALDERAGCIVIVEEALAEEEIPAVRAALARLPAWFDPPLIFVGRNVTALGDATAAAFPHSGNVTLLENPLNPHSLVSAVQVALRATARQREVGDLIAQRERAVQLRDEFLAMLAHELRNPLAPMRNALYMVRALHIDDARLAHNTDILERQVNHVVRMVDDLMDVARLERGKVALQTQRVDLNRLVASAVESSLPAAQARGHRVSAQLTATTLPVDADPVRVEQIVSNLLNNAAKFTPRPSEIRVATSAGDGFAVVAVEDQGIGFAPAVAEKLFDPFLQVNPTLERTSGGLGIGLTIVKRLAELHGGSVQAASAGPGEGSLFIVRLPLATGAARAPSRGDKPVLERRRRRVLVIEDNPDIRETLRMLLGLWGHEVSLAADGRSGLERVLHERPDVAVIDVGLPEMNGYDVARAIRKTIPNGEIRLIAMTGYGQPADRQLALSAGFDSHLLKPIIPEVLERALLE